MSNNKRGKVNNTRRRRNKKRNGGAGASASSPKLTRAQKMQRLLGTPGGSESGMFRLLKSRLLQLPTTLVPPRDVVGKMHSALESRVKTKRVENELFKLFERAQRLHATSFRDRDFQRCIDANVEAVKQLREAIDMGSFQARACLADMLLNGYTAGVRKNVREAMSLVSKVDDPDCQGVLAHCHFKDGIKAGPGLAAKSAADGSKYGQFVLGLYEMQKGKTKDASDYFTLAAAQNYDEAQIALGKIKMQSDPDEALRLLNLAADQGNSDAFDSIAEIYRRKSNDNPYAPAFMDAMRWCKLAVDADHPYAYDTLSSMQHRLMRS